jgi:hypothetical protein
MTAPPTGSVGTKSPSSVKTARLRIWRGTGRDDGRYDEFDVAFEDGDSVLDGLVRIRLNDDLSGRRGDTGAGGAFGGMPGALGLALLPTHVRRAAVAHQSGSFRKQAALENAASLQVYCPRPHQAAR